MRRLTSLILATLLVPIASYAAPPIAGPDAEQWMSQIVDKFAARYEAAPNGMAQGAERVARKNALCWDHGPLFLAKGTVRDWTGSVTKLDTTNDGHGVLTVQLTPQFSLATNNNSFRNRTARAR